MNKISQELLLTIANLHQIPNGAVSFRENGKSKQINSTKEIHITPKKDKQGIDIFVKKNTKNQSLHIPVIITADNINELVYNDFYIEDNCNLLIVAGCGIHTLKQKSTHNGVHTFKIGKNCKIKYVENHIGIGSAEKELSPKTIVNIGENSTFEMLTTQLGGVSIANRLTSVELQKNAKFIVKESILTEKSQSAISEITANLIGKNSRAEILSRVVAKDNSIQKFVSNLIGNNDCFGRVECDGIIMNNAKISSTPQISAENKDAVLSHEAQIGKIANDALIKLMSLGLTQKQAEQEIINGYLS